MASYPWESNAGAQGFGDVRHEGGGGGGGDFNQLQYEKAFGQQDEARGKTLHEGLGPIAGRAEDYSDYGAGGPGEQE